MSRDLIIHACLRAERALTRARNILDEETRRMRREEADDHIRYALECLAEKLCARRSRFLVQRVRRQHALKRKESPDEH